MAGKSDSQKMFNRVIKNAFAVYGGRVSSEVPVGIYSLDVLLNVEEYEIKDLGIEV